MVRDNQSRSIRQLFKQQGWYGITLVMIFPLQLYRVTQVSKFFVRQRKFAYVDRGSISLKAVQSSTSQKQALLRAMSQYPEGQRPVAV